ncbi:phosphotransferase family protein [Pseudonocardia spinosispora]|uniref:phosphotransferase family protein n=1 Tax=Pseudonocardia spinosispora TaxID=103441 RepID=UPI0004029544|nr:phosphotransferase [Pseudonocardia spinosispora]
MTTSSTVGLPTTIEEVDRHWLTQALRESRTIGPHARVSSVEAQRIALETGFSSELYRLRLTGDETVPSSVVVKLPTTTAVRQAMDLVAGYSRELAFYERVAGRAPLGTPKAHVARMAETGTDFVLVLEDLGDWENTDHLTGLPFDRARQCIAALADLHAWSTRPENAEHIAVFPDLDGPVTREVFPALFDEGWRVYREHARTAIPASISTFAARFADHTATALRTLTERRWLVHGDIRADNLFFRDDRLAVVDFQLASLAAGPADIGYLVSQGLTTAERGGRDEQLLREYLDRLADAGVTDYGFDEAWRHYRVAVAFFLLFPVIAIRGWELLPARARELLLSLVERAVAAIEDIEALEVFA